MDHELLIIRGSSRGTRVIWESPRGYLVSYRGYLGHIRSYIEVISGSGDLVVDCNRPPFPGLEEGVSSLVVALGVVFGAVVALGVVFGAVRTLLLDQTSVGVLPLLGCLGRVSGSRPHC